MSQFTITIDTDNDAFGSGMMGVEIARLLEETASEIEQYSGPMNDSAPLRDANGNTVGEWRLSD